MINVSKEFRDTMEERTDFKQNADITFLDGTVLHLSSQDFTINNNSVTDGAVESSFPLGVAIARCIQIEIMNDEDQYSNYDFLGSKIRLYLDFELSETVERIEFGTFTVVSPETYGTTVIISAVDDMYKADKEYTTELLFPTTLGEVVRDSCTNNGITLATTSFLNDDFIISEKPTGLTHRELYGYAAMLACGNARINRSGALEIISYNFTDSISCIDGGDFTNYNLSDTYDGGDFEDYTSDVQYDGGIFLDRNDIHVLNKWKNLSVDTDDLVITGVQAVFRENNEEVKILEGSEGYVLQIDNPFITGKEEETVKLIAPKLIGGTFRKFEGDLFSNPLIEFMDNVYVVDRKGNCYCSIVTDANFVFYGYTTVKCNVESALRNSSRYYSTAAKVYQETVKIVEKEKTEREKAIEKLNNSLLESSGLYETVITQSDGSKIYYLHDKKTLTESKNVIKLTSNAVGLSTDGGKTFPAGFTIDGVMISKILQTEGINADWINAGALTIKDSSGKVIFSANTSTKRVNFVNGYFDSSGAHFTDGYFSGTVDAADIVGGYIEGAEIYSGSFSTVQEGEEEFNNSIRIESASVHFGISQKMTSDDYVLYAKELDGSLLAWWMLENVNLELTECATIEMNNAVWAVITNEVTGYNTQEYYTEKGQPIYNGINLYTDFIGNRIYSKGTKSRLVDTNNYGSRALYCYEMPTPYFGDIGSGKINSEGFCTVLIDGIFNETVNSNVEYQVFLQKEGPGDLWVEQKEFTHFVVKGTPNLSFAWEIKAIQKKYETLRLDDITLINTEIEPENELIRIASQNLEQYDKELEGLN